MNTLRLVLFSALAAPLALAGCGDDSGHPDAGTTPVDSGTPPVDTGMPPVDGGGMMDDGVVMIDAGPTECPVGACDLLTSDGCDSTMGEACYFASAGAGMPPEPSCAMAGTAGDGEACSSVNDCQEGFLCDSGAMQCRHICCGGSSSACPLGQSCVINIVDDMGMPTGVGLCRLPDTCDLLHQTGCEMAAGCSMGGCGCYPSMDGVLCVTSMGLPEGSSCTAANDCAPGFVCAGDPGVCMKLCAFPMGDPGCGMGQTCGGLTGFDDIGVCTPAMMGG